MEKYFSKLRFLSKSVGILIVVVSIIGFLSVGKNKEVTYSLVTFFVAIFMVSNLFYYVLVPFIRRGITRTKINTSKEEIHINKTTEYENMINEKNKLIEEIAYKLRLSITKRIDSFVLDIYPKSTWNYEKLENFTIFLRGGEFHINLVIDEKEYRAKVFITHSQDLFIDIPKIDIDNPKTELVNSDSGEDLIPDIDFDMDLIEELLGSIEKEVSIEDWFETQGVSSLQEILSVNSLLQCLVNPDGEVTDINGNKKLGKITGFPDKNDWEELRDILKKYEIHSEVKENKLLLDIGGEIYAK